MRSFFCDIYYKKSTKNLTYLKELAHGRSNHEHGLEPADLPYLLEKLAFLQTEFEYRRKR